MKLYAVIDTNVIVSALFSRNPEAPTVFVVRAALDGMITPLYHTDILDEYEEVLHRGKFQICEDDIRDVIGGIVRNGMEVFPQPTGEILIDMDDLLFYEVTMEKRDDGAYLVTGNLKHYPVRNFIVTPREMMEILQKHMETE